MGARHGAILGVLWPNATCTEEGLWPLPTLAGSLGLLLPVSAHSPPRCRRRPSFCLGLPIQSGLSSLRISEPPERFSVPQALLFQEAFLSCSDQSNRLITPVLLTPSRLAQTALPLNFGVFVYLYVRICWGEGAASFPHPLVFGGLPHQTGSSLRTGQGLQSGAPGD